MFFDFKESWFNFYWSVKHRQWTFSVINIAAILKGRIVMCFTLEKQNSNGKLGEKNVLVILFQSKNWWYL